MQETHTSSHCFLGEKEEERGVLGPTLMVSLVAGPDE